MIIAGLVLFYAWYWGSFENFSAQVDHEPGIFPDFVQFYYPAGHAVLTGAALPDSFYYSTFAAVCFAPFALLPLPAALAVWGVTQVAAIFALYALFSRRIPQDAATISVFTFLYFTNAGVLNNLKWGQVSVLLILAAFAAYRFYNQSRKMLSAAVLSAAIAFKFFPAVFLIYFVFSRDWRYVITTLFLAMGWLFVAPSLVMGPQAAIQSQLAISGHASIMLNQLAMGNVDSQNFAAVLGRLGGVAFPSTAGAILVSGGYSLLAGSLYLVYRIARAEGERGLYWAWPILAATIPFWIPSAWPHYFVFLPFMQALVWGSLPALSHGARRIAAILWMFSAIFSSILIALAVGNWFRFAGFGSLMWASVCGLASMLIVLWRTQIVAAPTDSGRLNREGAKGAKPD